MKGIQLLIASSFFIASTASAQISKGSVLLGGNLSFSSVKSEEGVKSPNLNLNLSPSIGKAVKENLVVGLGLTYNRYRNGPKGSEIDHSNKYGGDLFVRKYYPLGRNFYLFGQAGVGYSYYKNNYRTTVSINPFVSQKNIQESHTIGISAYPGISYGVSKRVQLEFGLNNLLYINYGKHKLTSELSTGRVSKPDPSHEFNVGTNLSNPSSINVGVRILLNNK